MPVLSHMCMLKERYDPDAGTIRWSLPSMERCYCQAVVRSKVTSDLKNALFYCPAFVEETIDEDMWFTDNDSALTQRENWTPNELDLLLERIPFCSK